MMRLFFKNRFIVSLCLISLSISVFAEEHPRVDKIAVVTGASRGIGYSLVKELLEDKKAKIKVIAVVRDKTTLESFKNKYPDQLQIIVSDISTEQGMEKIVNSISESRIDYLVHNASVIEPLGKEALLNADPKQLRNILETNLVAPILLTNRLSAKLNNGSRILNISSIAGNQAVPGMGAYCVTKVGIDRYSESLQLDRPQGILVTSVHPGEVDTGMQADIRNHQTADFDTARFFRKLEGKKLISSEISAKYLKWLLVQTTDKEYLKRKHDIYDSRHFVHWNKAGVLPDPST